MPLAPEQRAEQNRINAQASTGPRTSFGKAAASKNATTHGLRAEALALPIEDQEELKRLTDDWLAAYQPETPGRRALLDRAVHATVQFHRGARFQTAALTKQVNAAEVAWDRDQEEQVAA